MEYRWKNRNFNVENVVTRTERFLRDRDFVISRDEDKNSVKLDAVRRREKYDVKAVEIVISWSPEELSIRFQAGDHLRPILQLSSLMSLWGGGSIVLKELKTADQYRKLEDEFWREMEETVSGSPVP